MLITGTLSKPPQGWYFYKDDDGKLFWISTQCSLTTFLNKSIFTSNPQCKFYISSKNTVRHHL